MAEPLLARFKQRAAFVLQVSAEAEAAVAAKDPTQLAAVIQKLDGDDVLRETKLAAECREELKSAQVTEPLTRLPMLQYAHAM